MIGHCGSYLRLQIQRAWWPRHKSFDGVAVQGGATVRDFKFIQLINNEFSLVRFQSTSKNGSTRCTSNEHCTKPDSSVNMKNAHSMCSEFGSWV